MKAAMFEEHGPLENLFVGDVPEPVPGPGEVVVKMEFAALNHLDHFILQGWPGLELEMPHVLGADGAGIVHEVGPGVDNLVPGDRVTVNPGISCMRCSACLSGHQNLCRHFSILGEHRNGTFAEYFVIPSVNALRVPDGFPLDKAAAAPLVFLTAWRLLVTRAGVKVGDTVLVHGAGGGVSTAAIQIAKLLGATVIATSSSPAKLAKATALGADHVINYRDEPGWGKWVYKELTGGRGVDVVLDSVGKATFQDSIRLLKPNGILVIPGATTGPLVELDLRHVFWKQLRIMGSTMSNFKEFLEVMSLVFAGKLSPVIDSVYSLEKILDAEKHLDSPGRFGKILVSREGDVPTSRDSGR